MIDGLTLGTPLGPNRIEQRISEIEAQFPDFATRASVSNFGTQLAQSLSQTTPLSPFGPGLGVIGSGASPEMKQMIADAANRNGIDPDLMTALVNQESSFVPTARSKEGAMGLTQLMPDTAQALGVSNPFDPAQNLDGGARYLKQLMNQFGRPDLALAAYNAGPGAVQKFGGIPPYSETRNYVKNILGAVDRAKGIQQ